MNSRTASTLLIACGLSLFGFAEARAQESPKKPPSALPPGSVEVRFTDGGYMRMTVAEEFLELTTPHGRLKIAVADIRRLDLATRVPESTQRQIEQAVADLSSPQYKVREKATTDLIALRDKAYPAVLKASQTTNAEVSKRAKDILEAIRAKVSADKLRVREKDVVYTSDSTIAGRLELPTLTATTHQFGSVQLKLSDAASIHFLAGGAEMEVKLDGRYALSTEVWLDTHIDVSEATRLTINATGEIDMYATGGYLGQYVGSPKGKKAWPGSTGLPIEPGTLVGRIGETGKVFVVKDQFEESAPASGRLYLRAAGNPYTVQTQGHYTIKIQGGLPGSGYSAKPE